jgi:hypothetical protein
VDAWVHWDLAAAYDGNRAPSGLSQGDLFRVEAVVSVLAAVALLVTARLTTWLFAWLVAASAFGALLLFRYYDLGAIGPLPDMYEPLWFYEKALAGVAEGIALGTATIGLLLQYRRGARSRRTA